MNEYISREAAINITAETGAWETQNRIRELPATDVQPIKHGRWINVDMFKESKNWKCSCCKGIIETGYYCYNCYYNYCPNCGAKMDIIYEDDKIRAIKVTGWDNDARNLANEETDIYNNRLEAEAKTID